MSCNHGIACLALCTSMAAAPLIQLPRAVRGQAAVGERHGLCLKSTRAQHVLQVPITKVLKPWCLVNRMSPQGSRGQVFRILSSNLDDGRSRQDLLHRPIGASANCLPARPTCPAISSRGCYILPSWHRFGCPATSPPVSL